jgi:hypothetical protein
MSQSLADGFLAIDIFYKTNMGDKQTTLAGTYTTLFCFSDAAVVLTMWPNSIDAIHSQDLGQSLIWHTV